MKKWDDVAMVIASLVDSLNDNAGAIQALGSIVLVVITGAYVWLTGLLVRESRRSQRPYVYVDVLGRGAGILDVALGNRGERAAEDVTFRFRREPTMRPMLSEKGPFRTGVKYLPPGRTYAVMTVVETEAFGDAADTHVLEIEVSYRQGGKRHFTDVVHIDLADLNEVLLSSFHDEGVRAEKAIKDLTREAKGIKQALEGMRWQLARSEADDG